MRSVVLTLALLAPVSAFAVEPLPVREMPLKLQAAFINPILFDVVCAGGVAGACGGGGGASLTGTNTWTGTQTFKDNGFVIEDEVDGTKEISFSVGGMTTGNSAVPIYFTGTAANPLVNIGGNGTNSVQIQHNAANGIIANVGGGTLKLYTGATEVVSLFSSGLGVLNAVFLGATAIGADARIEREAAAVIQLGADVNAGPVTQTLKAHDGIIGTDRPGASLILAPGLGTGAAASNPITLNRQVTKATGTTAQTYAPAMVVCPTKILSNTSATAQTIATITTTTTTAGSVTVDYATTACSASTCDADSGLVKVSWNNNAGTVAAAMTAVAVQSDSDATGTLATTPTATVATNVVSVRFTPTWVTIVPSTVIGYATFKIHSAGDTVVCQ